MPSNDSPAFDVLSAEENDLWEWAVERAGVENAATYIRDAAEAAVRARLIRCGGSDAGLAYGKLRKDYDAQRAELKECVAKLKALRESRDTDLARARVEGIREGLTRYADSLGPAINARDVAERMSVLAFRDREYPAPKPAECRKRIGDVHGIPMYADPTAPKDRIIFEYEGGTIASCAIHPDSPVLRKNAATRTEDTTDGR